ncbi:FapA family protein [Paenibacillus sp.]|uniref:DUF342 domain-containing protein n=1 Tax=Paenibacillus sp. TaxID=58172 RepID=UPI002811FFE6|nr:FapA family protein [Paenibacillus sp.]
MALSEIEILKLIHSLPLDDAEPNGPPLPPKSDVDVLSWAKIDGRRVSICPDAVYPLFLETAPEVRITVNGQSKSGRIAVTPEDLIEWDAPLPPMFAIDISEDRMIAWFKLFATSQHAWRPIFASPEPNVVRLEVEEDPDKVERTLDIRDVQIVLHNKKLFTYNLKKIEAELRAPTFERIPIAEGIPPVPSVDAFLELLFKETVESSYEEINGQVDFRNHLKIPSAKAGEVIARKIPAKTGTRGCDIFGSIVEPAPPREIVLVPKQHVYITPAGDVVALKEGRPRITGERVKFISVNPEYVVSTDVDLKTGNIFFSGDVTVYGNVTEGMTIEALGNVYVSGSVYNATITATGSILVKGNVIGAKMYSGHFGVVYNRLFNHSKKLNECLQNLRNGANRLLSALEKQGKSVPEGQAYQLLADTKFKEIPAAAKEILGSIVTIQNIQHGQMEELKQHLVKLLQPSCFTRSEPLAFINALQYILIETSESIQRCEETNVLLDIPKCQLSTLMSNGDILIRQEGVVQSDLYSKHNIVFYLKHSVCKGSTLEAGHTISAMTVGGTSGGACVLKAGVKIMVAKMFDGRIFIQRFSKEILESLERTLFHVQDNRLLVERIDL